MDELFSLLQIKAHHEADEFDDEEIDIEVATGDDDLALDGLLATCENDDDLRAVRQMVLMVAVSEMTHLRWVNQMLWLLDRHGVNPDGWHYTPINVHLRPNDFRKGSISM